MNISITISKVLFTAMLSFMVFHGIVNAIYGIDDYRTMMAFEDDEARITEEVRTHLRRNDLRPNAYNYGYLYEAVSFWSLRLLDSVNVQTETRTVAFLMRALSLASFVVAIILTAAIARRVTGSQPLGYVAGLAFAAIPNVNSWAQKVHPDMMQVALILFSLFLVIASPYSRSRILAASAIAGLAFGTKYSGLFVLPFLWVPFGLHMYQSKPPLWWRNVAYVLALSLLSFALAWLISNPYIVREPSVWLQGFQYEHHHVTYGPGKAEPWNPLLWLPVLSSEIKPIGIVLLFGGLFSFLWSLVAEMRASPRGVLHSQKVHVWIMLGAYTLVSLAYLLLQVRYREIRYSFHVLPIAIVLGVAGIYFAVLRARITQLSQFLIVGMWGAVLAADVRSVMKTSSDSHKYQDVRLTPGTWLSKNYDSSTRILADYHGYVPVYFTNMALVWGIDQRTVKEFHPDIIMLKRVMSGRWFWKKEGTSYQSGQLVLGSHDGSEHYYSFGKDLLDTSKWEVIYETDENIIFKFMRHTNDTQ